MTGLTDLETLVAYVDGELNQAEAARVERALSDDAEARETVRGLREGAALLRAAFNEPIQQPVPARIYERINAELTPGSSRSAFQRRRWTFGGWPAMALAASLAVLLVGVPGSYYLADYRLEQKLAQRQARLQEHQGLVQSAVSLALEKRVSGESVEWSNPDTGSQGQVTPVRTFKSTKGQWCREYVLSADFHDSAELQRAIACREADGQWKTRLILHTDS